MIHDENWNLRGRANRLNQNFKWTEKNAAKLRKLNEILANKQESLQRKMVYMAERIGELAKSEFPILRGFKVYGELKFSKSLPSYGKEDCEKTKTERSKEKKWEDLEYSQKRHFFWKLQYNPDAKEFTVLSKMLLEGGKPFSMSSDGIDFCGYLYSLLDKGESIALPDLLECDENDWQEYIDITVNFPDGYFFEKPYNRGETLEERLIDCRKFFLDENFNWSEENVKKILEVNAALIEKIGAMREQTLGIHKRLAALAKVDEAFRGFYFGAELQYQNRSHPTDIADLALFHEMEEVFRRRPENYIAYSISDGQDELLDDYSDEENASCSWDSGLLAAHFTEEQKKLPFSRAMHELIAYGDVYSLEDLVRMKMEDWKPCFWFVFW